MSLPRHIVMEQERQQKRILIVNAEDCFYLRLPGYLPAVLEALKSLIPYERRHPDQGLGWMADQQAWAFDYDDQADIMELLDQLLPNVAAQEVEEFPQIDRTKGIEP